MSGVGRNKGGVEDFSNIIWEALFCGTPCIVNSATAEQVSNEGVPKGLRPLIRETIPGQLKDYNFVPDDGVLDGMRRKKTILYEEYIESNANLYESAGKSSQ